MMRSTETKLRAEIEQVWMILRTERAAAAAQAERVRVLEGEVTRLKTMPMKYRRMEFNAQLQHENATLTERIRVLRDALEKLTACKAVEIRLRQLHEMGHGTDYDQHRQQFADAWMKARAALERTQ